VKEKGRLIQAFEIFLNRRETGAVISIVFLFTLFTLKNPAFLSLPVMQTILVNGAWIGMLATGQSYTLASGEFDLSVESVFGLAALLFVVFTESISIYASFLLAALIAAGFGFVNGLLVTKAEINSLIATLGMLFFGRGIIYLISRGFIRSLSTPMKSSFLPQVLAGAIGGGWSALIIWMIALAIVFEIILFYTKFGNHILAVGSNAESSLSRGISPGLTKWKAFLLCSTIAGFAGMTAASELISVSADLGDGMALKSIAACVIGGCSLRGGKASVIGAVLGAIFLSSLSSGLILMGAPPYSFISFVGLALVGGVMLNKFLLPFLRKKTLPINQVSEFKP